MNMIAKIAAPATLADRPALQPSAARDPVAANDATASLSPADRIAILVSRTDGRGSLAATSVRTLIGGLFGFRRRLHLAGERLEALRRYAILYRLEGAGLSLAEDDRLMRAGVSARQARSVRALVDAMENAPPAATRGRARSVLNGALLLAAAGTSVTLIDLWLARQVDDALSALMVTIMFVTGVVSMLAVSAQPGPPRR
jgi:hypothetical protein